MTTVLDGGGAKFAELFEPDNRRQWVPLAEIPESVQKAFLAAEDKRFLRAQRRRRAQRHPRLHEPPWVATSARAALPSKQQVAKNLLVAQRTLSARSALALVATHGVHEGAGDAAHVDAVCS